MAEAGNHVTVDDRVRELVAAVLEMDVAQVGANASFHEDLEVDSLQKTEICARVEREFRVQFEPADAAMMRTVTDMVRLLRARDLVRRLVGRHLAAGRGDRVCYRDADAGTLSYAQLHEAARGYAAALADLGVRPGSRGLVVSDDSVAAVVAVIGLWWHGCVPVPVSPMLRESEIVFIAGDCAAGFVHLDAPATKAAVLRRELGSLASLDGEQVRRHLRAGTPAGSGAGSGSAAASHEPAALPRDGRDGKDGRDGEVLVQYTSGSTGTPKGVRHSLTGIEAVLAGFGSVLALTPDDVVLSTAKLSFGYGFGNALLFPLAAGASTALLGGPVDPFAVSAALRRERPTVLCSVPRLYAGLLDLAAKGATVRTDSLRLAVSAGEHLPAELSERFAATFGVPLVNGLGATEVLHIAVATRPAQAEPGSTGHAVPGVTLTVRDEDGQPQPPGAEGRLHVAGPAVALGYIGRPEATARTFADGGAYTGDIVLRAADGDVRHRGRADDMLNLGGFKVSPTEIESVVRKADGVADCAVVAEANRDGLEQAVAYVVPSAAAAADDLRRAVRASVRTHLAPFKRPARIEVLDQLPVTSTGKLARFTLRAREESP
jgi:acyl carrier protein